MTTATEWGQTTEPHYPLWSILVIALDVAILWALAVYRRDPL
jgi:hypothetical protein